MKKLYRTTLRIPEGVVIAVEDGKLFDGWFEEIKEEADCIYRVEECIICPKVQPTEKEECKHEDAKPTGEGCYFCNDCRVGFNYEPQSKAKPSEEIEKDVERIIRGGISPEYAHYSATLAFLDKHFKY